jgi:hypothetical protein
VTRSVRSWLRHRPGRDGAGECRGDPGKQPPGHALDGGMCHPPGTDEQPVRSGGNENDWYHGGPQRPGQDSPGPDLLPGHHDRPDRADLWIPQVRQREQQPQPSRDHRPAPTDPAGVPAEPVVVMCGPRGSPADPRCLGCCCVARAAAAASHYRRPVRDRIGRCCWSAQDGSAWRSGSGCW